MNDQGQPLSHASMAGGTATAAATSSAERFRKILSRTIARLNDRLKPDQLAALADAFTVMSWEFPDVQVRVWLVVDRDSPGIRLEREFTGEPGLTVQMDAAVLQAAAAGETSLGTAFVTGRLHLRGLNPLFLARFVMLIEPLLGSFRASMEEEHGQQA